MNDEEIQEFLIKYGSEDFNVDYNMYAKDSDSDEEAILPKEHKLS